MTWRMAGQIALAALFAFAGVGHFVRTEDFVQIVPDYLPWHRGLVLVSGAFEVILAVLLLVPKTSRLAAWGLIALLVAVFPANISMYQHADRFPTIPPVALLIRLPLQALLILWAYAYARRRPR
jgi:uncharacterized membrane protein